MDKHTEKVKDIEICTVPKGVLQYTHGVMEVSEYDKNLFHKVYREISEQLGIETALTIHQMFKGTQVNFPVRFFDTQCVKEMIIKEYDGTNAVSYTHLDHKCIVSDCNNGRSLNSFYCLMHSN